MRFNDKVALVTGGSSGIGLAAACLLASEGAKVILVARDSERLDSALQQLPGTGHQCFSCDVSDEKAVANIFKQFKSQHQHLDIAILAAGSHIVRPLQISKSKNFLDSFSSNVLSTTNVMKCFSKIANPEGASIVMLSSAAAIHGGAGVSPYVAAKGAIASLTHAYALELAPKHIRVNSVLPGVVDTPMSDKFLQSLPNAQRESVVNAHPLGLGKPDDVAHAIAYLASDEARWVTGSQLVIDGGLTCH